MSEWYDCLIGFGANLGNLLAEFEKTRLDLASAPGIRSLVASRPIQTKPVGGPGQPLYLNGVYRFQTNRSAIQLHELLVSFEEKAGRDRIGRWQPRTLDLDLLLFGSEQIRTDTLRVPHPRMTVRRFVLEPAAEIASDMVHPVASMNLRQLLDRLNREPNQLVLVIDQNEIAERVIFGVEQQLKLSSKRNPNSSDLVSWKIVQAADLATFQVLQVTAKIVVWSNPRPKELQTTRFSGPQIEMPLRNPARNPVPQHGMDSKRVEDTIAELQAEIVASIEAANG